MASSKERIYAKTVRRAIAAVTSEANLNETLAVIVRGTARSMKAGASLVLLDAYGKKLVHSITWGLSRYYIQKGMLDSHRSLSEVVDGQTIIIEDVSQDSRVQYRHMAINAGIVSIIGTPIMIDGLPIGSIRVYTKKTCECSKQDIDFIKTIASIIAIAFKVHLPIKENGQMKILKHVQPITFAHSSEKDFTRILDFYNMEWVYEPRSFPLKWDGDRVTEMFTPDFYLPGLDLYVELTTLKQSLVTHKNRKLRKLKEMYPDINITLLYKNDYNHLLAKYGVGPLSQTRAHGIKQILYSTDDIKTRVIELAKKISKDYKDRRPILVGIQRGFICFMADLMRLITVPLDLDFIAISYYTGDGDSVVKITKDMDLNIAGRDVIVVEDIVDTGITLNYILNHLKARKPTSLAVCALLDRKIRRIVNLPINYIGFELPDEFVVGYGLDYREEYRNLPFIAVPEIKKSQLKKGAQSPLS